MKAVNVLVRINGVKDLLFIYMLWQGELDKDAVYLRVLIVLVNELKEVSLGYILRLVVLD